MKTVWHRFIGPLTPGVRLIMLILAVAGLTALIGMFSRTYDLYHWLALDGPRFWHGWVWALFTYALLPATLWDFLFNWILILFVGVWLERVWTRWELGSCCLLAVLTVGLLKVAIQPASPLLIVGTAPVVFGLLAAWGRLFPYEKILFWFIWETTVRQAAMLMIIISFVIMLPWAGLVNAGIMLGGAPAGWCFVWLRGKMMRHGDSRVVSSERMGRLEL